MRIRQLAVCTALATSLFAQDTSPGFKWLGLRAGTISFDPHEQMKAATSLGGQFGMVFDEQRYGFSLEAATSSPQSQLFPGKKPAHSQVSATWLTGLLSGSPGGFWPYFGVGLGSTTVAKPTPSGTDLETSMASALHASFGLVHRPLRGIIWGVEGRYQVTLSGVGLNVYQGTAMLGFTWGGGSPRRPAAAEPPPARVEPPSPPVPPPAPPVVAAPEPAPVPAPAPAKPPVAAPMVTPVPMAAKPEPLPPPPPPPPPALPPPALRPAPAQPAPAIAAPAPAPRPEATSVEARLEALRKEDTDQSLALGRKYLATLPAQHWTLRLEVASLPSTLRNAVGAFPGSKPDLFVAPLRIRGGKVAYQLFLGHYATRAEAERAAKAVPAFFLEGGQRPRLFQLTTIPSGVKP